MTYSVPWSSWASTGAPHRRMHVAGEQRAEPHVVVDVLVAVDVDHPRARRVAHHDGMRVVCLEARRDAGRHHLAGPVGRRLRGACALAVHAHLTFGDLPGGRRDGLRCYGIRCRHGPILAIPFVLAYRIDASRRPRPSAKRSAPRPDDPSLPIREPPGTPTLRAVPPPRPGPPIRRIASRHVEMVAMHPGRGRMSAPHGGRSSVG